MPFKSNFMGFTSAADFLTSQLGASNGHVHTLVVTVCLAISTFVGGWIWATPFAVFTLWALMGLDYITGIAKAIMSGTFVSFKLWRMPIYYIVTTLLLSLSFWMAQSSVLFVLLPTLVMAGFMSVYFISLLENLGELELLPKALVSVLKSKFGLKTLIEKYNKKESEES